MSQIDTSLTEPPSSDTDTSGADCLRIERKTVEHDDQFSEVRPRYEPLKRFAKALSKRFAIRLSAAQEMLCRASGFDGMNHLHQLRHRDDGASRQSGGGVSFKVWRFRLRSELGADFDELMTMEEQLIWWTRLHGRRQAVLETQRYCLPAKEMHG